MGFSKKCYDFGNTRKKPIKNIAIKALQYNSSGHCRAASDEDIVWRRRDMEEAYIKITSTLRDL